MRSIINDYYEIWLNTNAIYEAWAKARGISYNILLIIYFIYDSGEITLNGLCAKTFLPKQTISSILDGLERKEYIHKTTSTNDRRNRNISLTPAGNVYVAKILQELRNAEEKALDAMPVTDQEAYVRLGRTFIEEFSKNLKR